MKESIDLRHFTSEAEKSELSVLGPGSLDLFYAGLKKINLPSEVARNPLLLEQAGQRRHIFEELNGLFKKIPDVSMEVSEAVEKGLVNDHESDLIYADLSRFLEADQNNARLILYLPFQLLPNLKLKECSAAEERFAEDYKNAWFWLLDESDVRASFVDGDVLEPGLGQPLRVRKACHLIPELFQKGIIQIPEILTILEQTSDRDLIGNLIEGLTVARDQGLVADAQWRKILHRGGTESDRNQKQSRIEVRPENYSDVHQIENLLKRNIDELESKYATGSSYVQNWSEGRIRWEKKVARGKILHNMAAIVAREVAQDQFPIENIKNLANSAERSGAVGTVGLIALFSAVEIVSERNSRRAKEIADNFKKTIENCWNNQNSEFKNTIISGLSHWQKREIINENYLRPFEIRFPDFSSVTPIDLEEPLSKEFKPLVESAEKIKADPDLSQYFYPSFLLFGSRIKGYSLGSDVDAGMFIRPEIPFEKREGILKLLHQKLPELANLDKMAEFWISEKNGKFGLKTPPKEIFTVAEAHQINFFFGGIWISAGSEMKSVYSGIIGNYLDLSVFGNQKNEARTHLLRRLEMDTLQYRLLQKGYRIYYPNFRPLGTENSELIDWESDFWDPGFRRIASLQFLARVFLPDLSGK